MSHITSGIMTQFLVQNVNCTAHYVYKKRHSKRLCHWVIYCITDHVQTVLNTGCGNAHTVHRKKISLHVKNRQCTYNVALRLCRVTIFVVKIV